MVYFRWYPVVSHFNNPPQLDVLVPSARQRLVSGPGWEFCGILTSSTLMESTMRDTHPNFYCWFSLPGVFDSLEADGAPWVLRLPRRPGSKQDSSLTRHTFWIQASLSLGWSIRNVSRKKRSVTYSLYGLRQTHIAEFPVKTTVAINSLLTTQYVLKTS